MEKVVAQREKPTPLDLNNPIESSKRKTENWYFRRLIQNTNETIFFSAEDTFFNVKFFLLNNSMTNR